MIMPRLKRIVVTRATEKVYVLPLPKIIYVDDDGTLLLISGFNLQLICYLRKSKRKALTLYFGVCRARLTRDRLHITTG